jgi:hypothetical protein
VTDQWPNHFQIIPGVPGADTFYLQVYHVDGSTLNVAKVTFYPGNPPRK